VTAPGSRHPREKVRAALHLSAIGSGDPATTGVLHRDMVLDCDVRDSNGGRFRPFRDSGDRLGGLESSKPNRAICMHREATRCPIASSGLSDDLYFSYLGHEF
jgi:hypothetical protein